jgi:hypothetical protein
MAFMDAMESDTDPISPRMNEVRKTIRTMIANNLEESNYDVKKWRLIYKKSNPGLLSYSDVAMNLSADYPFKQIRPTSELAYPYVLHAYADFPQALNEFWKCAKLDKVWGAVRPYYITELHKYNFKKMDENIADVCKYMKKERENNYTIVTIPNLINPLPYAQEEIRENYCYFIETPEMSTYGINVHEYLHTIVNPLVSQKYEAYKFKFERYFNASKKMRYIQHAYDEIRTYICECLVRALDNRIEKRDPEMWSPVLDNEVSGGFLLELPFYLGVKKYEQQSLPFSQYIDVLFQNVEDFR